MGTAAKAETHDAAAVVGFGLDEKGKPHASAFDVSEAKLARKAAGLLGMHAKTADQRTRQANASPASSASGHTVTRRPAIGDQSTLSRGAFAPNMMQVASMLQDASASAFISPSTKTTWFARAISGMRYRGRGAGACAFPAWGSHTENVLRRLPVFGSCSS